MSALPPLSGSSAREEHVTTTGWRVVGGDAISLVAGAADERELLAGRAEDVLYAARFQMRPRMGGGSALRGALAALGAAVAREWPDAPPLTPTHPVSRRAARFHGLRWETAGERGAWTGELVWRRLHPVLAGVPCTTHVILTEQLAQTVLAVRVSADDGLASVRGSVGAGQARPAFLTEMHRALRMVFGGQDGEPRPLEEAGIDDFVRDRLLSETRELPVAVLAPLEEGGYVVPPPALADELLGLAHLYVMDRHPTTFRLSDTLGDRRLSCYWGALRIYMPGFSCAERPEDHPLLVRERLDDPVIRADLVGKLGRVVRQRVLMPPDIASRRPPAPPPVTPAYHAASDARDAAPAPATVASPDRAAASAATAGLTAALSVELAPLVAGMPPLLSALGGQIGALAATIATLVDANRGLADEIARMRTTTAVRAASTTSLERRIGGLEDLLRRHLQPATEDSIADDAAAEHEPDSAGERDDTDGHSLLEVLRQAATAHADALLVLDAAERSASDSPYADMDRVAIILDAMAEVARRRQEGALGTPLRVAFRELGIDYRGGITASTSERHREQYVIRGPNGQPFDCREHIVLGTSYDPRHCLRIYFTSRAPVEPRFVIGHVGRHFDVASTT